MNLPVIRFAKALANVIALAVAFPAALTCWAEHRARAGSESLFGFWTNVFAMLPGLPGMYLRRAFYAFTLRHCSLNCYIGFGSLFSHRRADVEDEVYIGAYAMVGSVRLRRGCLIGTRASLLSGSAQHELREDGKWAPTDASRFQEIEIGPHAWIGEAAIVMADVGAGAMAAAGSVVSAAVPPGIVVAGNPARFIREPKRSESSALDSAASPVPRATRRYEGFLDWMKCLGMIVICYGHLAGWAPLATLSPIYSKQFGVAFFLFITGYSLSLETRDRWHVVFNRLFEVYLYGLAVALLMSAVAYLRAGQLQLSNYFPLLLGMNVLFDNFPANPTTWYLGTYVQLILVWAFVARRIRVSMPWLLGSLVVEIAVRAVLMDRVGLFVAYMLLPNWSTVFLLGRWYGQSRREGSPDTVDARALAAAVALAAGLATWSAVAARLSFERATPFQRLLVGNPTAEVLLTSAIVSILYLSTTWLTFQAVRPLVAPWPVRFVARNTLLIFLVHMPVLYLLGPTLNAWVPDRPLRSLILMAVCIPGLALVSEGLRSVIQTRRLRDRLYASWSERSIGVQGGQ